MTRAHSIVLACLQMLADIRPNEEHVKDHIARNPVTTVAQVVPEMSEHEVSPFLAWRPKGTALLS